VTIKSAFTSLGAAMSLALVHGSPCVEKLALPKSAQSGNLSLNKTVVRRMSVQSAVIWGMSA
jgi:hypothetical protein